MANKKGGLGRGLSALLPQTQSQYSQIQPQDTVHDIQVSLIQPNRYQPRREFDANALNELAESIKSYGILQPIIVRKIDSGYELIAGERRLRASKIVGLENIPAIIREYTDAQMSEISIIENVQRENLNVIEEAQAYDRLIKEFGHTQEVVAAKIGRSRSHISNIMRLLKLSPTVRALIAKGLLTLGQARPLLAIENEVIQVQAAEMILSEGLSVRKVEAFINELKNSGLLATLTANIQNTDKPPVVDNNYVPVTPNDNVETQKNILTKNTINDNNVVDSDHSRDKIIVPNDVVNNNEGININQTINENEIIKTHSAKMKSSKSPNKNGRDLYIQEAENKLTEILGAQVKITNNKKVSRIQIDFASEDELSRIVETFDRSMAAATNQSKPAMATTEEKIAALRKFSTSQRFSI
ncbi:MAG: ParB/RepB/Spo0J family partition protein [Selenomonadaceae bacterium]|nr:ParB/RepB/Spo0J family partition protein [Selenomonadaceae bacterium]